MKYRILFYAIYVLAGFWAAHSANAKHPDLVECPFLYKLPEEIKPLINLNRRDLQKQSVIWRITCRRPLPFGPTYSYSFCRFEPTQPHRRICSTTSRWNNRDYITEIIEIKKRWTDILYSADAPNGYRLIIRAVVEPNGDAALDEETLQKILKISTSIHVNGKNNPLPAIILNEAGSLPDMLAVKKAAACPFEFKLPTSYVAKIDKFPRSLIYSGKFDSGTWSILCSNNPKEHAHLKHLLDGSNCYVETTPPHHKICWRSKRWDGTEQLVLSKINWQTQIQYQAYTSQDQWLFVGVTFNREADQTVIEKTLEVVQAIAASVKPVLQ